mgnify:CR=1 FL=1
MTKQYCTTKSTAARLGISRERVRQLAVGGHIPARREGAHWFFDLDDIERLAATRPPRRWGAPIEPTVPKTISPNALAVLAFSAIGQRLTLGIGGPSVDGLLPEVQSAIDGAKRILA